MYIDFHIHAYADEIADRAVKKLKDTASCEAYTNGRIDDTRQKLKAWGVDYGVLLPVATKPTQQTTINNWAIAQNHGNIISFGTVLCRLFHRHRRVCENQCTSSVPSFLFVK